MSTFFPIALYTANAQANTTPSHCSIQGLCDAVQAESADKEENIRCVILFDNEEVSSAFRGRM